MLTESNRHTLILISSNQLCDLSEFGYKLWTLNPDLDNTSQVMDLSDQILPIDRLKASKGIDREDVWYLV